MKKFTLVLLMLLLVCSLIGCNSSTQPDPENTFSFILQDELLNIVDDPTADVPWEHSAGVIDYENTEYLLLLPNCEISVTVKGVPEAIVYSAQIHPWVVESSDGAGFELSVVDSASGNICFSKQINIEKADKPSADTLPLGITDEGEYTIILKGNSGSTGDETCDWLVFGELGVSGSVEITQ